MYSVSQLWLVSLEIINYWRSQYLEAPSVLGAAVTAPIIIVQAPQLPENKFLIAYVLSFNMDAT